MTILQKKENVLVRYSVFLLDIGRRGFVKDAKRRVKSVGLNAACYRVGRGSWYRPAIPRTDNPHTKHHCFSFTDSFGTIMRIHSLYTQNG